MIHPFDEPEKCAKKRRLVEVLSNIPGITLGRHIRNGWTEIYEGRRYNASHVKWGAELLGDSCSIIVAWERGKPITVFSNCLGGGRGGAFLSNPNLRNLAEFLLTDAQDSRFFQINPEDEDFEQQLIGAVTTLSQVGVRGEA